jgi:hypothetical protein
MLGKNCSCMFSKVLSWRWFVPFFDTYSNWGMQTWITKNKRSQAHQRWNLNGSGHELLVPIAPNKNGQSSYKNLNAMIGATHPQLPKYVAKAITFTK